MLFRIEAKELWNEYLIFNKVFSWMNNGTTNNKMDFIIWRVMGCWYYKKDENL